MRADTTIGSGASVGTEWVPPDGKKVTVPALAATAALAVGNSSGAVGKVRSVERRHSSQSPDASATAGRGFQHEGQVPGVNTGKFAVTGNRTLREF